MAAERSPVADADATDSACGLRDRRRTSLRVRNIAGALGRASSALLGCTLPAVSLSETFDIDVGVMGYSEQDRNTGIELLLDATRALGDDELSLGLEFDTLTGATPNGATASDVPQTFTRSSGAGSYTVDAGELPADDTHADTRLAVSTKYVNRRDLDFSVNYSARVSMEFDYLSFGAGNGYRFEFNKNNTQLDIGFSGEYNLVHPVGNIPDPLAPMTPEDTEQNRTVAKKIRTAVGVGLGLTQVLDKRSIMQIRYTLSRFAGYLNDPYKILSVIDDQTTEDPGRTLGYVYEERPDVRDINTLYLAYKRDTTRGIVNLTGSYSMDDWGIRAGTVEARYRHALGSGRYVQPHLRLYRQHEADFYEHSLPVSESLPRVASSDSRLASFDALTAGLDYGVELSENRTFNVSIAYYTQDGTSSPDDAIGLQRQQDLFPRLHTVIAKFGFGTQW